jgi:hypothetical protein
MSPPLQRKVFDSSGQHCGDSGVNREALYSAFVTIFCYRLASEICPDRLMTSTPSLGLPISLRAQSSPLAIVPWTALAWSAACFRQVALAYDAVRFEHGTGGIRSNPRAVVLSLTDIARHRLGLTLARFPDRRRAAHRSVPSSTGPGLDSGDDGNLLGAA